MGCEKIWNLNFSDVRTLSNHPLPRPGTSEISKPPPPHLPDVLCRRPLTGAVLKSFPNMGITNLPC